MPLSGPKRRSTEREFADEASRRWAEFLPALVYKLGTFILAIAAAGIAIYAFTVDYAEGARAVIFFVIPSLWGAYLLAVLDGRPTAIEQLSSTIVNGLAIVVGLVLACVLFLDTPIAIANLALGVMEAFFFTMRISDQPTSHVRHIPADARILYRAFLIMTTIICAVVVAAL